ncbi:DUF222 domain-containing protein [Ruania alkalisoli]|uniref:DUF222 domain-containing protein n=1 Tax=Ruania alkalisoli TaxID=2779775 RepID=A0A7M1STP5_9MICO|nr:HNH endonuclease signature motif containing protein [Ruania alkalisoli]QOR70948.1 DUF222 domain-containing protein [Ruania alkalisoli]
MSTTSHVETSPAQAVRDLLGEHVNPSDATGRLEVVTAILDDLLATDLHSLPSAVLPDLVGQLEQTRRRVDALTSAAMTAVEADGIWAVSGARTIASWWANATGGHGNKTRTRVHLSRTLRDHLPHTSAAQAAGVISGDHAAALARHTTTTTVLRERLSDPDVGERFLVEQARRLDADSFTRLVKTWAIQADPEAADRNWRVESAKEHLFVSATTGGYRVDGWLEHSNGHLFAQTLDAIIGVPAADDDRTRSQRNAHALVAMARRVLDNGGAQASARVRPHLLVHVPVDTLHRLVTTPAPANGRPRCTCHRSISTSTSTSTSTSLSGRDARTGRAGRTIRGTSESAGSGDSGESCAPERASALPGLMDVHLPGCPAEPDAPCIPAVGLDHQQMTGAEPATLADGTPISHAQLAHLACDGEFTRVIFDPAGQPLDVGRAQRLHTAAQTKAIWARDRHCQYPECTSPPGWGEIHHPTWWSRGGRTSSTNAILLCWHHHALVHQRDITITRHHNHWHFTTAGGHNLARHRPPPCEHLVIPRE